MALIAKMQVDKIEVQGGYDYHKKEDGTYLATPKRLSEHVQLKCVYTEDKDHPNFVWAQATPSGSLELQIDNEAGFGYIDPAYEYHVTISRIRPEQPK